MKKVLLKKQFSLLNEDYRRGLIATVISAVLAVIIESLAAGSFDIDWATVRTAAIGALVGYLVADGSKPTQTIVTNSNEQEAEKLKGSATIKL